jgi:hypothetical protein
MMQIAKLGVGQLTSAIFGSRKEPPAPRAADGEPTQSAAAAETSVANTAAYREILSNYDMTFISPREFSQLIHELRAAGAINDADLQELASIRFELDRAEYDPDAPVNLMELFKKRLENLLQASADAATDREASEQTPQQREEAIKLARRQVEWLQKFSTIHAETATGPINTLV